MNKFQKAASRLAKKDVDTIRGPVSYSIIRNNYLNIFKKRQFAIQAVKKFKDEKRKREFSDHNISIIASFVGSIINKNTTYEYIDKIEFELKDDIGLHKLEYFNENLKKYFNSINADYFYEACNESILSFTVTLKENQP